MHARAPGSADGQTIAPTHHSSDWYRLHINDRSYDREVAEKVKMFTSTTTNTMVPIMRGQEANKNDSFAMIAGVCGHTHAQTHGGRENDARSEKGDSMRRRTGRAGERTQITKKTKQRKKQKERETAKEIMQTTRGCFQMRTCADGYMDTTGGKPMGGAKYEILLAVGSIDEGARRGTMYSRRETREKDE